MPSKQRPISFRSARLRRRYGAKADKLVQHWIEGVEAEGICPVCGKTLDDCDYFKRLENDENEC